MELCEVLCEKCNGAAAKEAHKSVPKATELQRRGTSSDRPVQVASDGNVLRTTLHAGLQPFSNTLYAHNAIRAYGYPWRSVRRHSLSASASARLGRRYT